MRKLSTIQKREKLNQVYAIDEPGVGGASHEYGVIFGNEVSDTVDFTVFFQNGPRKNPDSQVGVLDTDLLEIVRDRLKGFQSGEFACKENACALAHIEEALMWLNLRVKNRIERNVLGTTQK